MSDEREEGQFRDWLGDAAERNAKGMEDCGFFLGLFSGKYKEDSLCLLQFGLAMVLDKPIVLVVEPGTKIPKNVRRVAVGILECDIGDPGSKEKVAAWTKQMMYQIQDGIPDLPVDEEDLLRALRDASDEQIDTWLNEILAIKRRRAGG
jgi:hypothetical protein